MKRHILVAMLFCAGVCFFGTVAAAESVVLKDVRALQTAHEQALATGRAARLQERAELLAKVHAAEQAVQVLSTERQALAAAVKTLQEEITSARRQFEKDRNRDHNERASLAAAVKTPDGELLPAVQQAVAAGLARLEEARLLRQVNETVFDRNGRPVTAPILHMGSLQALALGSEHESCGFVVEAGNEAARVAGVTLPPALCESLRSGVHGILPVDIDGSLATQNTAVAWSFVDWIASGGVFAWPIIFIVIAAFVLALERLVSLLLLRTPVATAQKTVVALREQGATAALALVQQQKTPLQRVQYAGLSTLSASHEQREAALEAALLQEEPRFERSLGLLAVCAAVAPLLGLLGTVTGMIATFDIIAVHGTGNPRLLSGGISEALVTTQMGLLAAVPILLMHAIISRIIDKRQVRLEEAATALMAESTEHAA